jgi:hypothetical protein
MHGDTPFLEDALWYESLGYGVAQDWLSGRAAGLETMPAKAQPAWVMVMTVAILYYAMGGVRSVIGLLILYSALTALVPVLVYFVGRELRMPESAARRGAWLVALSPAFVFWSGSLYKEGMILLALSLTCYFTLQLQARWRLGSFAMLIVAIGALFGLRFYIAVLTTLVVGAGLLLSRERERTAAGAEGIRMPSLVRQAVIVVAFIGIVVGLGFTERAERRLMETPEGVLVEIEKTRYWLAASAGSGYLPDADISTPEVAAEFLPVGLFYFLTVPLPWQIGPLRQNLIIPETAFWLLLYPFIIVGFIRGVRVNRSGALVLGAMTVGMCVIYALLSGNIGTAYRMRSQVWLLWAPFAAWGWEVWRERQGRRLAPRIAARRQRRLGLVRPD